MPETRSVVETHSATLDGAQVQKGVAVDGRFAIEALAGSGAMGHVYRARDIQSGETVALKVVQGAGALYEDRFRREAVLLSGLRHPNIVRYIAHGVTAEGQPYLAMEWLEGEDLAARLARGRMPVQEAIELGRRVADALAVAHRAGIVHRDIKPTNLFLVGGSVEGAKVIDFGVARLSAHLVTASGIAIGTPGYMAPEQARGDRDVDARVDVFALGCVLFECLAGRPPFVGEHVMAVLAKILLGEPPRLRELRVSVPPAVDDLVAAMMSKDRDRRPADGAAVVARIAALGPAADGDVGRTMLAEGPTSNAEDTLGDEEQSVVCVIATSLRGAREVEAQPLAPTLVQDVIAPDRTRIESIASAFGARLDWPADGSMVAVISGTGAATDRASLAARCALELRAVCTEAPLVLTTGRGVVSGWHAMGEAIDRAAAMLRRALADGVPARSAVIDHVTAGLLPPRFDVVPARGRFALLAEAQTGIAARTLLGRPTPHVGREQELAMLLAAYEQAAADAEARGIVVVGPPGAGKSRLADELLRALGQRSDPPAVWLEVGDPLSRGAPLRAVARALRRVLELRDGAPDDEQQNRIVAHVAPHFAEAEGARVAAFLGELVMTPFSDVANTALRAARSDPRLMGDQLRRAWLDLVRATCATSPLAIVLEDAHWADRESIEFIGAALREVADLPLFVVALAREEGEAALRSSFGDRATTLALPRLSGRAAARLVRSVLGDRIDDASVARLVERCDGNPFHLEELIRAVAEGRGEALPETVLAMMQTRLATIDDRSRRVLRAASIFGRPFRPEAIAALTGSAADEVRRELRALVERELVTESMADESASSTFAFRHALVREAAYAMLTETDRELGHRLAAQWLDSNGRADARELAEHYERGACPDRAVECFARAAREALERNGFEAALEAAERAVRCGAAGATLGEASLVAADAHFWRGEYEQSERAARDAHRELVAGSARYFEAAARLASASEKLGRVDEAAAIVLELCAAEPTAETTLAYVTAAARAASHMATAGRKMLADRLLDQVRRFAGHSNEPTVAAQVAHASAWEAFLAGDVASFMERMATAAAAFERCGDLRHACATRGNVGYAAAELGDYEHAMGQLTNAIEAATRLGTPNAAAYAKHNLGLVLARLGRLEEAVRVERDAIAIAIAQHDLRLEASARAYLARILLLCNESDAASDEAQAAARLARTTAPLYLLALAVRAEVELERGNVDEARLHATEAHGMLARVGADLGSESLVRLVHAEALRAAGSGEAQEAVEAARANLLERAAAIHVDALRERFLGGVPENARILELAASYVAP